MSASPRFGGGADHFFEELAKAQASLEAGSHRPEYEVPSARNDTFNLAPPHRLELAQRTGAARDAFAQQISETSSDLWHFGFSRVRRSRK